MTVYDRNAPRKAVNLSVNSDLLARARALGLNLSAEMEARLTEVVRSAERERWIEQNQQAIEDYNRRIEARGPFSKGRRRF
ncbi:MAG: type II toxin-antitoxin system CcdA family antitoxin [Alphaproteobacteria bacterium]